MNTAGDGPAFAERRAKELRQTLTGPERVLWNGLRGRRFAGLKFRRQHPIGPYIVDFYCDAKKLVVELDGASHDSRGEYDKARQSWIESEGYKMLRISNDDVLQNLEESLLAIAKAAGLNPGDIDDRFRNKK
ncbi:endonuclease domain-containing protein [Stratiformator vulcanicus]|uniref:DUF559 domain-containing protein n=1 Tax=Stratiformator vulcanicus TaxID=2527980 RepID=A0A517QW41_9PLAN|nr:DUF559 domain-containing protein [Stratiformator vulcanicus]QDT35797.1 hypothetical protein Pan189_01500 [Stratiformator vulcanicus]